MWSVDSLVPHRSINKRSGRGVYSPRYCRIQLADKSTEDVSFFTNLIKITLRFKAASIGICR